MNRRGFLQGLAGILAAGAAPAFIHDAMKVTPTESGLLVAERAALEVPLRDGVLGRIESYVVTEIGAFTMNVMPHQMATMEVAVKGLSIQSRKPAEGRLAMELNFGRPDAVLHGLKIGDIITIER